MYEQDRVIVRLQQRVLGEPAILACFLTGSHGRRAGDAYSDLDVTLVFADDATRETAFNRRWEFVRSVLPYVPAKSFDAEHVRPYLHIALYGNGTKADYLYVAQAEMTPSPWVREIRILKDHEQWAERLQQESARLPLTVTRATISSEALARLDERFWIMFWDAYRQVLRGDHDKPFLVYLQVLSFTLPELLQLLPAEDPAYQGLLHLYFSHDAQATAAHMRQLFAAYLQAREAIIRRHNLVFAANAAFEKGIQRLIQKG